MAQKKAASKATKTEYWQRSVQIVAEDGSRKLISGNSIVDPKDKKAFIASTKSIEDFDLKRWIADEPRKDPFSKSIDIKD